MLSGETASPTMSVWGQPLGHKWKSGPPTMTSALPLEADVEVDFANVGDVPIASYSSRSTARSAGNSFIHKTAMAIVPMPPSRTAGMTPSKAAVIPLSNSPSW